MIHYYLYLNCLYCWTNRHINVLALDIFLVDKNVCCWFTQFSFQSFILSKTEYVQIVIIICIVYTVELTDLLTSWPLTFLSWTPQERPHCWSTLDQDLFCLGKGVWLKHGGHLWTWKKEHFWKWKTEDSRFVLHNFN